MTRGWAVHIPKRKAAALGALRCESGLSACEHESRVWLRGEELHEPLEQALKCLPGVERFAVLSDGQLMPSGSQVPLGHLPEGPWESLAAWLSVELEPAAWAGQISSRVALRMVRSPGVVEANLLLTTLADWRHWAETAAQARLNPLAFAVSRGGDVVVRGAPAPPLPGTRFVERQGVAAAAGWRWEPAIDVDVVRELLGLAEGDCALLHADQNWERIPAADFVRASRSAVRRTAEGSP